MKKKILLCFVVVLFVITSFITPIIYVKLSYKTKYSEIIIENLNSIENKEISKNLILAIIKTESNFNEKAKSSSDAFGLMQLQFLTAKDVATKLNLEINLDDLYNPSINIKLGINYFNYLFDYFNDKQLALISYNAGINRVNSWINENILVKENGNYKTPYKETTEYLKKVLRDEKIYNMLKG